MPTSAPLLYYGNDSKVEVSWVLIVTVIAVTAICLMGLSFCDFGPLEVPDRAPREKRRIRRRSSKKFVKFALPTKLDSISESEEIEDSINSEATNQLATPAVRVTPEPILQRYGSNTNGTVLTHITVNNEGA